MIIRTIVEDYEAKLVPAQPPRGGEGARGKAEWERYGNDQEELSVRVRNVELPDETSLDVFLSGGLVGCITLNSGRGLLKIESRKGEGVPHVTEGNTLTVSLESAAVLEGTFVPD